MTDLKPEDLVALREIAEKATPGPWHHCSDGRPELSNIAQYVEDLDGALIAYDQMTEADAAFIAAFNPQVALSLLADRARMEKALREAERELAFAVEHMGRTGGGYERALVSVRQALGASQ